MANVQKYRVQRLLYLSARKLSLIGILLVVLLSLGCGSGGGGGGGDNQNLNTGPSDNNTSATTQVWRQVGKTLNVFDHGMAGEPSLAIFKGTLYASWVENEKILVEDFSNPYLPAQLFVKYWNGTEWIQTGSSLNTNPQNDAVYPRLTAGSDSLFLAFTEITKQDYPRIIGLYVKQWDGKTWSQLGGPLNIDPESAVYGPPSIMVIGNTLYVAWSEYNPLMDNQGHTLDVNKVYVKYWNGSEWVLLGGPLNIDLYRGALLPSLTTDGNSLYVGFLQTEQILDEIVFEYRLGRGVYVKKWDGSTWKSLGDSIQKVFISESQNPFLDLVVANSSLYLLTERGGFYIWDKIEWKPQSGPGVSGIFTIASIQGSLYVILNDNTMWRYQEDGWIQVAKGGRLDPVVSPFPSFATDGEKVFLGYRTCDPYGCGLSSAVVDGISINGE